MNGLETLMIVNSKDASPTSKTFPDTPATQRPKQVGRDARKCGVDGGVFAVMVLPEPLVSVAHKTLDEFRREKRPVEM